MEQLLEIAADQANRVRCTIDLPPIDTAAVTATPPNNAAPIMARSADIWTPRWKSPPDRLVRREGPRACKCRRDRLAPPRAQPEGRAGLLTAALALTPAPRRCYMWTVAARDAYLALT